MRPMGQSNSQQTVGQRIDAAIQPFLHKEIELKATLQEQMRQLSSLTESIEATRTEIHSLQGQMAQAVQRLAASDTDVASIVNLDASAALAAPAAIPPKPATQSPVVATPPPPAPTPAPTPVPAPSLMASDSAAVVMDEEMSAVLAEVEQDLDDSDLDAALAAINAAEQEVSAIQETTESVANDASLTATDEADESEADNPVEAPEPAAETSDEAQPLDETVEAAADDVVTQTESEPDAPAEEELVAETPEPDEVQPAAEPVADEDIEIQGTFDAVEDLNLEDDPEIAALIESAANKPTDA